MHSCSHQISSKVLCKYFSEFAAELFHNAVVFALAKNLKQQTLETGGDVILMPSFLECVELWCALRRSRYRGNSHKISVDSGYNQIGQIVDQ